MNNELTILQYTRLQAIKAHEDTMKHILAYAHADTKKGKAKANRKIHRATGRIAAYQDIIATLTGMPEPDTLSPEYHGWLVAQGIAAPSYTMPDGSIWQAKDAKPYGLFYAQEEAS